MLVAILVAFFLGGPSASAAILTHDMIKSFETFAQQVITDPDRAEAVRQELKALNSELKQFDKVFAKSGRELSKLYKNYDTETASMQAQLDSMNADWESAQSRALDHRFAIRNQMTKEEWDAVVSKNGQ
ncbi:MULTISPECIES: hypothetical protein [unclassified Marinobacter]|uniref:hypothetical protein n=1 Tax=unclassified Marinobacter TaxID=83889 RepID=UPI0026E3E1B3|nr:MULTISPECIES: hypothetical protein [unclassified Marinobacter]MDO6442285.1 hypothetical protein [Marinobacter sp. 2_MG-2023]MDO6824945.1 hypothetical protein [Marinobacter sp. 1_MG-2023]